MKKESKIYSDNQLRQLIDAYFEGSIPPSQLTMLLVAAKAHANGELPTNDPQLAEDLRTVSAIEDYAQAALLSFEEKIPADLESRLDIHISQLASRSRRKWMWIKTGGAAACVALLLTAGIHYLNPIPSTLKSQSENRIELASVKKPNNISVKPLVASESAIATPSEPTTEPNALTHADESALPAVSAAAAVVSPDLASASGASNINRKSNLSVSNKKTRVKTLAASTTIKLPYQVSETTIPNIAGAVVMPDTLSHITEIMPNLLAATAEVQQLISSPFAAIGQTFDKVVESLNVVNATMYEANKTAAAVSQEFLEASTAPLRSI